MFKKTSSNGGGNGRTFDDGVHDGVLKVTLGEDGDHNLLYVKINYENDGGFVEKQHGKEIGTKIIEFKVDHPNEYITSVHESYSNEFKATEPIPGEDTKNGLVTLVRCASPPEIPKPVILESSAPAATPAPATSTSLKYDQGSYLDFDFENFQ